VLNGRLTLGTPLRDWQRSASFSDPEMDQKLRNHV